MRIVFHGENAAAFSVGFADLLDRNADIAVLPDALVEETNRQIYAAADVIVGGKYDHSFPRPENLKLFHVPGAGYDAVDLAAIPASAVICNCFGHEQPIAEYVMATILTRLIPLADADRRLRQGNWAYWGRAREQAHDELAEKAIGLLGFGHIGKAVAIRAKAFDMHVHAANRSPIPASPIVDRVFDLSDLTAFWKSADFFVVSLPLTAQTKGLVGAEAFAVMRPTAVVINVGRGPIIDERALYHALTSGRIAGAAIDTWYRYPSHDQQSILPSDLPFHELPNIIMTPHMSGWTYGTIRRRQKAIADNIIRRAAGQPCMNEVRPARI